MSTLAQPAVARTTHVDAGERSLSFGGILRSEWIKLRSLRSSWWSFGLIILIQLGITAVFVFAAVGGGRENEPATVDATIVASTIGLMFAQLVIAVLGVLVISGEYSTGQIRSSFMAVPARLPVLAAKSIVFGVATFVVGLVAVLLSYLVTILIFTSAGVEAAPADAHLWLALVGAAGYLVFLGLISLGIGAILRSTAGGIAASLGLLLVVPTIFQLIPAEWASKVGTYLPGTAGQALFPTSLGGVFEPWQALLIMLGWVAVALAAASVLIKRRDA
jgi:ABC-2 type transport system permease protein